MSYYSMRVLSIIFYVLCGLDLACIAAALLTDRPQLPLIIGALFFGILGAICNNIANKKKDNK